jgi:hypothetical protein
MPATGQPAVLFLQLIPRVNFVGISVGIGDDRRQKYFYIQMVMVVSGYRPGAPSAFAKASADKPLLAMTALCYSHPLSGGGLGRG